MKTGARIFAITMLPMVVCCGQDRTIDLPPLPDNAALQYSLAFLLVSRPVDFDKDPAAKFAYGELLAGMVPVTEALKPEIRKYCEHRTAVIYLHKAARMTRCDFGVDYSEGLYALLPHLGPLRHLARCAVLHGNLLEAEARSREAAEVHCDVLAMGPLISQEHTLVSNLVGMAVGGIGSRALQSLLAHDPGAEACELALTRLSELPDPYIRVADVLPFEAALLRSTLFTKTGEVSLPKAREILNSKARYDAGLDAGAAADLLEPIDFDDPEKARKALQLFYDEYLERIQIAVEMMTKPFPETIGAIQEMENEAKWSANPLLRLCLVPGLRSFTEQAKVQVKIRAARLLAGSALHKAKTGQYPQRLEELQPYFPKGIPRDPMTERDFAYGLEEGAPRIASAGPPSGIKEGLAEELYVFSVAKIRARETTAKKWGK